MQVNSIPLANQQQYDGAFPLVMTTPTGTGIDKVLGWLTAQRDELISQVDRHGAILFRGFPVATDVDFDRFIQSFDLPNFTYVSSLSNAVRVNRTERVFTANEAPRDVSIYFHHEMAQTPVFPSRLFFFCEQAATEEGATPLCRSDILLNKLRERRPDFVKACEDLGVKYTNVMPEQDDLKSGQGRSWSSTVGSTERSAVEAKLHALGYSWKWMAENALSVTTPTLPAVRRLRDGRDVFFNQLIAAFRGWADSRNEARKSISFGDGSQISSEDMAVAIELSESLTFDLQWQTGDVAILDNFTVMHGRRPFLGTRKVLASLVADDGTRLQQ